MSVTQIKRSVARNVICVEYPGIVENQSKAVLTLGGEETISRTYATEDARLALRFRYEDVYCKPAYGNRHSTNNLLIRVKQKKNKKNGQTKLHAELIGLVETTYKFDSLMDYQYLTMERKKDAYESLVSKVTITKIEGTSWLNMEDSPLHLIPTMFSRTDVPYAYNFKGDKHELRSDHTQDNLLATARKKRQNFNQLVPFESDDIPNGPMPEASLKVNTDIIKSHLESLTAMFKERPIWSRAALNANSPLSQQRIKMLSLLIAYCSTSGPWRTMWIRHGYNPKKDPSAKKYQVIDYRYRGRSKIVREEDKLLSWKRSYSKYKSAITKSRPKTAGSEQIGFGQEETEAKASPESLVPTYIIRPGLIPAHRQMFYQLCDIEIPSIQLIASSNDGQEGVCDRIDGFLKKGSCDKIRAIINETVERTLRIATGGAGACFELETEGPGSLADSENEPMECSETEQEEHI